MNKRTQHDDEDAKTPGAEISQAGAAGVEQRLIGSWRLLSVEARRPDGTVSYPFSREVSGLIMYDPAGTMSVQLMRRGRARFAGGSPLQGAPQEIKEAFEGYIGYYGRYRIDDREGAVIHDVEGSWFPNWEGTDQKRYYSFLDNTLTLSTPPLPGYGGTVVLVWERVA